MSHNSFVLRSSLEFSQNNANVSADNFLKLIMKSLITILCLNVSAVLNGAPRIESLSDLRALEEKVKAVVKSQTDATISLVSTKLGSSGSGVIVSADGLILTAAHVTAGSKEMTVIFPDGRQEKAKVLGANDTRDASMAQLIGAGPWPFSEIGNSDELEVGDFVVAMGHPKGFDPTRRPPVRFGRIMTRGEYGFITTDCTVVGGDSGGPLFDLEGRVVGIHSHIASDRKINNHAGISGYLSSWEKMHKGDVWGRLGGIDRDERRPVLGLVLSNENSVMTAVKVPEKSPAYAAGLRVGDVILKVAGEVVDDPTELRDVLIDLEPGDKVGVAAKRGEENKTFIVKLAALGDVYELYLR